MPEYYADWWYEDLPVRAKEAAAAMGYDTKDKWDESKEIPYKSKTLAELTYAEKVGALYLGMKPFEDKTKTDIYWEDADETTQRYSLAIGCDQQKWDEDWLIHDLPIEHKYWEELTDEEREGAKYFGYTQPLWDEVEDDPSQPFEDIFCGETQVTSGSPPPAAAADDAANEEKKEDGGDDGEESEEEVVVEPESMEDGEEEWTDGESDAEEETATEPPAKEEVEAPKKEEEKPKPKPQKRKPIKMSKKFGGADLGDEFKSGNVRHLDKVVVYADSHVVKGIEVTSAASKKLVGHSYGKAHEFELERSEFITFAKVRASRKSVQSLEFRTNKGRTLGPCGGKGYLIGKDRKGTEYKVAAPFKYQLCGFQGSADDSHITSIGFSWGPVPPRKK